MDGTEITQSTQKYRRNPQQYAEGECEAITKKLETKLDADEISYRQSAQGNVAYVEGWRIITIANEIFGFNGWCSEILEHHVDFIDTDAAGRVSTGITCRVRVSVKDGTFHDDIGYGTAENQKSKAAALEKAKKESVTDAIKRALRQFGDRLGNCTYDKVFLRDVKAPPTFNQHQNVPPSINRMSANPVHQPPHPRIVEVSKPLEHKGFNETKASVPPVRPPLRPPPDYHRSPGPSDSELYKLFD